MQSDKFGKLLETLDTRVTQALDLGEFHERLAGQSIEVWMNPPRKVILSMQSYAKKQSDETTPFFIGAMLDLSAEETQNLYDRDVAFCNWLTGRVLEMYASYSEKKEKKSENA